VNDDDRHALRDALYVLFKRRLRIVVLTLTGLAVGIAYGGIVGPTYTASARILVTPVPAAANAPAASQGAVPSIVLQADGQTARNQAELFRDPGVTRALVPALERRLLRHPPGFMERAGAWLRARADVDEDLAARLSHALAASAVGDTDVVVLRFTWPERDFAASALNQLLTGYQGSITQAADARQAMKLADAGLREAEAQVRQFDTQLDAVPVGGDAGTLELQLDRTRRGLDEQRGNVEALRVERDLAQRKLDMVEQAYRNGGWVDSPDAQDAPPGAPALQQTFVTLLDKHQTMLTHQPPDSASVRDVDRQISHVREQNYLAVRHVYSGRVAELNERLTRINAAIATDEASVRDIDNQLVKVEALSQSRAAAAAHVAEEQRRFDDAKLQIDAVGRAVSGLRVLSPAVPPARPDAPSPFLLTLLATACGFGAGIISAFLAEATRRTIDRPRDILYLLDVELLARVPDLR
jgi:uncharacterized protein involved in exopolysaccharide biosynthesis